MLIRLAYAKQVPLFLTRKLAHHLREKNNRRFCRETAGGGEHTTHGCGVSVH